LVIKALDPDPDPYWSPASNSGSGKNEYGSETLIPEILLLYLHIRILYKERVSSYTVVRKPVLADKVYVRIHFSIKPLSPFP